MKYKIIDYLTLLEMQKQDSTQNASIRVRSAWILAKKRYLTMSLLEKKELIAMINEERNN